MVAVDGHLHVFKARSGRYPRATHPMYPPTMEAPVEPLLEAMQHHRIDHAVLVALSPHDEYVGECLSAYPRRFRGIGVLDQAHSNDADDVARRFDRAGLSGLRVHHLGGARTRPPDQLETWPVLAKLADLDGVVWLYVPAEQLSLLPPVLERLPDLRVVLNHLGWPLPDEFSVDELGRPSVPGPIPPATLDTVLRLAAYPSVSVMFSGEYAFSGEPFPYMDLAGVVGALYEAFGAHRMLWASDYPWIMRDPGYGPQLGLVDHYLPGLHSSERAAIMGGTAAELFSF